MRVLIINTSEKIGGAAIAANRLMEALKNNGVSAKMLVRDRQSNKISVVSIPNTWKLPLKFLWERFVIFCANKFRKSNLFQVDIANTGTDITDTIEFKQADVVHLHWINQGFLSLADISKIMNSGKPVVVTMHDMWYFTGICHYSAECDKYTTECKCCPLLYGGGSKKDLSNKTFNKKQNIYSNVNVTFVGCSKWLTSLARKSKLFEGQKVVSIPNAINTNMFHRIDKQQAKANHNLPEDKRLILFGAKRITDERKGFKYLVEACNIIKSRYPEKAKKLAIVVVGAESETVDSQIPLDVHSVRYISEERDMVELYNAVDLYVTPSLQDNLPNTIVEAMACGVPCVGFNVGGIPEMIDHLHNGYVAEYCNAEDFANGILWALDSNNYDELCEIAEKKAKQTYSEKNVAEQYLKIYNEVMK
jgi:glycosyltransferase involved in cell wall biosynthesis